MMSNPKKRAEMLLNWESAPAARLCHPREDHLIPLMAALGAAENDKATRVYYDKDAQGVTASSYRIGRLIKPLVAACLLARLKALQNILHRRPCPHLFA